MQEVIDHLDQIIAAAKSAAIPLDARWLDAEGVGAMLSYERRYVLEKLAERPDFPKPIRLDENGHPRWLASEVQEFARKHRASK